MIAADDAVSDRAPRPAAEAPRRVVATAPGKVNLALAVGAPEPDGYHPLATVFLALDLVEEVEATASDALRLAFDPASPIEVAGLACDDSNLAIRAARALAEHAGIAPRASLRITKRVPIAGGMGGGSADAAATLLACDALWGLGTPREELHAIARALGADVPFALEGGAALGTGRGDLLEPVPARGPLHLVLVLDGEGMSTPATYRELDRLRDAGELPQPGPAEVPAALLAALAAGDAEALGAHLANDLEAPAIRLRPRLAATLAAGRALGAAGALVSGSGPTVALLAASDAAAAEIAASLAAEGRSVLRASGPAGASAAPDDALPAAAPHPTASPDSTEEPR